jgi:hypothetical protein
MGTMMAFMTVLADEAQKRDDAIRTLVLMFLASYLGIALGTAFLFEGVKMLATKAVTGRENLLVLVLTLALGALAKWLMPALYGETDRKAWALHMVSLVFVSIIGMMFHDKLMDAVKALLKKLPIVGGGGGGGAAPPAGGAQ